MAASTGNTPIQAGKLRRKLTILQRATSSGIYGEQLDNGAVVLTTWGSVTVKPGNALIAAIAGQMMAQSQYTITLRYPPSIAISPGMRVQDGARTFTVHQVADVDERHHIMQLFCVEEPAS